MPEQPRTQPLSWWEKTTEAVGWFVALVLWNASRVPAVWRRAPATDRAILVLEALLLGVVLTLAILAPDGWDLTWAFVVGVFGARLAMEFVRINRDVAEREKTLRLLATEPAGAPRMAVVQCAHGDYFRFAYGPDGWQEIGPATPEEIPR